LLGLVTLGGCSVTLHTTGAATVEDLQAEDRYKAVYNEYMTRLHTRIQQLLAPTATSPGVCNVGGDKQGCYDADTAVIADFQALKSALDAIAVPPRFVKADQLLREGIAKDIEAMTLRNRAIAENDDAAWTQHQSVLEEAVAIMQQAYAAYPEDNRPQPPP
jgi:hypothetical protein